MIIAIIMMTIIMIIIVIIMTPDKHSLVKNNCSCIFSPNENKFFYNHKLGSSNSHSIKKILRPKIKKCESFKLSSKVIQDYFGF